MKKPLLYLLLGLWLFSAANAFALNPMLMAAGDKSAEGAPAAETVEAIVPF